MYQTFVLLIAPVLLLAPMFTRLSFQILETIKPVNYCKIIYKAMKIREGNLIRPDNDLTIEAI